MSNFKILAIDTVTEGCSAALLIGEEIVEQFEVTPRGHTQKILPMVDQLLAESGHKLGELDAIAFDRGPGSFTGLRITAGVVQGLAYGADLPVVAVSSLAALARAHHQATGATFVLSAIDARMGEVYWGAYRIDPQGIPQLQGEEMVVPVVVGGLMVRRCSSALVDRSIRLMAMRCLTPGRSPGWRSLRCSKGR